MAIELTESEGLGPLNITEMVIALPGLKYPVDLSGGVLRFRNRRGQLERLVLSFNTETLSAYAGKRVEGLFGPLERPPWIKLVEGGIEAGFSIQNGALGFRVLWEAEEGRLILDRVRQVGLSGAALVHAVRAVSALLGPAAENRGRSFGLTLSATDLLRGWLPGYGMRLPSTAGLHLGPLEPTPEGFTLTIGRDANCGVAPAVLRALENFLLLRQADDRLVEGDLAGARMAYLRCLEEAPRHPEALVLLAEMDLDLSPEPRAPLEAWEEADAPATSPVWARLLVLAGDEDRAAKFARAYASAEPFAPLAGWVLAETASGCRSPRTRRLLLDEAVARCPSLLEIRWLRFTERVRAAEASAAEQDAREVESMTHGALLRHAVAVRVARCFREHGHLDRAAYWFERSLRTVPDDADATLGLAGALSELGKRGPAIKLLMRSIALGERQQRHDSRAYLDLGILLAQELDDLPSAIARVRQVTRESGLLPQARYLEATWRVQLGDRAGAASAYTRLMEALELGTPQSSLWVEWILSAASFALHTENDPVLAENRVLFGLRVFPGEAKLGAFLRNLHDSGGER